MKSKIKALIITQNEKFTIPSNVELLVNSNIIDIICIYVIDNKSSLFNKKLYFFRGFGFFQSAKMFIIMFMYSFLDNIYRFTKLKLLNKYISLTTLSSFYNIPLFRCKNINSFECLTSIREYNPDVIVSYSAPVVFSNDLLRIPSFGCLNLHCSRIPSFCGVMPSFWILFHKSIDSGVTVHLMDDKIDNGSIVGQLSFPIHNITSMYELIFKSKLIGGKLMLDVLTYIYEYRRLPELINVSESNRTYYSWPTYEDFKKFKKIGFRLI